MLNFRLVPKLPLGIKLRCIEDCSTQLYEGTIYTYTGCKGWGFYLTVKEMPGKTFGIDRFELAEELAKVLYE